MQHALKNNLTKQHESMSVWADSLIKSAGHITWGDTTTTQHYSDHDQLILLDLALFAALHDLPMTSVRELKTCRAARRWCSDSAALS